MLTRKDQIHLAEIFDRPLSNEDKVRAALNELPHLNPQEMARFAEAQAEECRMDAAELHAGAEASRRVSEILGEWGQIQMLQPPHQTLAHVIPSLEFWSRKGDQKAQTLLQDLLAALSQLSLGDHLLDG